MKRDEKTISEETKKFPIKTSAWNGNNKNLNEHKTICDGIDCDNSISLESFTANAATTTNNNQPQMQC